MLTQRSRRALGCGGTTGSIAFLLVAHPSLAYALLIAVVGVLALTACLLLPAIWSRQASRRTAVLELLRVLLNRPH